jgi:hypothetical protein
MPWRDSISVSRPITLVSSVVVGDDTTRPRHQGVIETYYLKMYVSDIYIRKVKNSEQKVKMEVCRETVKCCVAIANVYICTYITLCKILFFNMKLH